MKIRLRMDFVHMTLVYSFPCPKNAPLRNQLYLVGFVSKVTFETDFRHKLKQF